jgi:hypothetical protein
MLALVGVVGITIINQWAQAASAYQIEQIAKCPRPGSTEPSSSLFGLAIPVNYDIEEVKSCCKKRC